MGSDFTPHSEEYTHKKEWVDERYFQQKFHNFLLELFDRPHKGPLGSHLPHLFVPVLQTFTNLFPNLLLLLLRYSCPDMCVMRL